MLIDKILDYDFTSGLPIIFGLLFAVFYAILICVLLCVVYGIFAMLYVIYTEPKRKDKVWAFVGFLFFLFFFLLSAKPAWETWKMIFKMFAS